jgi:flagellar protein FlbD
MITVTRLDNSKLLINLETIKFIEATPDSLVTFVNGDSLIIRESLEEIERRVIDYRVRTLQQLKPGG